MEQHPFPSSIQTNPFLDRAKGTAAKLKNEVPDCNVQVFCLDDPRKLKEEIEKADILVNGTLVGMKPHEDRSPITDKSVFRSDLIVCDVVYNPEETKLLREAKEAGCAKTIGGKGMLLWQGVAAYKLYTGPGYACRRIQEISGRKPKIKLLPVKQTIKIS